jgi:quercetin dioxygenase-like cupin family protein
VYTPSPHPSYSSPTHIPQDTFGLRVWGDDGAGRVLDWVHVSTEKIHQLVFALPSGARFGHSHDYRTIFAADVFYYVLSGTFVVADPETGEAHRLRPHDALLIPRDTWHHGFNCGAETVHVVECISPPPKRGTTRAYSSQLNYLAKNVYAQDQWLGRWPEAQAEVRSAQKMTVVREQDTLWRLEGRDGGVLVGIITSTEHSTMAKVDVLPGRVGDVHAHAGDEIGYVLDGRINVRCEGDGHTVLDVAKGDAFYIPEGEPHQYLNWTNEPTVFVVQVAPSYATP